MDQENFLGAKGVIPQAQGIFASICRLVDYQVAPGCGELIPETSHYCHTCELVKPGSQCTGVCPPPPYSNPGDYEAVFQSRSGGNAETTEYTPVSQEMDDILFQYDLLVCQSQANVGNQNSRPQAWAKNIVSVGGVIHNNTVRKDDDSWQSVASIGPALDGRIKPDFIHFAESVYTTNGNGGYSPDFGGTSAATPITCGHFGLFFQMWAGAIFGNSLLDPNCNPAVENCVFKNRPHMTTAKAMMINTASQYDFSDPPPPQQPRDFTRTHQGWGLVQVGRLHILRSRFPVIVDETRVLDQTQQNNTAVYTVTVPTNVYALRATMVYADPPGNPAVQSRHAVNDLTLKVTSPNGTTVYWGNCGLREGIWSSSACASGDHPFLNSPSTEVIDTVENVFVHPP